MENSKKSNFGNTYNTFDLSKLEGKHSDYHVTLGLTADLQDLKTTFTNDFRDIIRYNKGIDITPNENERETVLYERALKYAENTRYIDVFLLQSHLDVDRNTADKIIDIMQSQGVIKEPCTNGVHKSLVFNCDDFVRAVDTAVRTRFISIETMINELKIDKDRAIMFMETMQADGIIEKADVNSVCEAIISEEDWTKRKK